MKSQRAPHDNGFVQPCAATQLGFAPVEIGKLAEGGVALHVLDGQPGGLLLQNLAKLG